VGSCLACWGAMAEKRLVWTQGELNLPCAGVSSGFGMRHATLGWLSAAFAYEPGARWYLDGTSTVQCDEWRALTGVAVAPW
jgi:hypothetical protein